MNQVVSFPDLAMLAWERCDPMMGLGGAGQCWGGGGGGVNKLSFNSSGGFKIAQFADLHYGEAENTLWGPQQDVNSTRVMHRVLAWERPDLVVYTGDQVTGENINSNATLYWARLVQPCVDTGTRWATVFGNHDDLSFSNGTRRDLLLCDTSHQLSLSQFGPAEIHGLTNYYLLVYRNATSQVLEALSVGRTKEPLWVLYFLDSGGGTYPELVYQDQLDWFKKVATMLTQQYGPIPALAFFHIPSTGFETLYKRSLCFGMNDDEVTPQTKPNDLLSVLATYGHVQGVFVGHDHGDDWCCPWPRSAMLVCYGRHTGYGGYGRWPRGSRVIALKAGVQEFTTYVRMEDGSVIDGN